MVVKYDGDATTQDPDRTTPLNPVVLEESVCIKRFKRLPAELNIVRDGCAPASEIPLPTT